MRAVVVSAAIAAALAGAATTSTALEVQPCDGPRPINAQWERTRLELKEGQRMPAFMGLNCVPSDDSVSSTPIAWGDGAVEPASVTYTVNSEGTTKQAWIGGSGHAYARAVCPAFCTDPYYEASATVTEDQTGQQYELRARVTVVPGVDVITLQTPRPRAGRVFHGRLATVHTDGLRYARELWVAVRWDDGVLGRARVYGLGSGHDFDVVGTHRWRKPGGYAVHMRFHDALAHGYQERVMPVYVAAAR